MSGFFEKHREKIAFAGSEKCWLWVAGRGSDGYGSVWMRGEMRKAHREAFEDKHGLGRADGLVVRHKCDVRLCVNPAHLELGTVADNNRDRDERGRQAKGEAIGAAKLTEANVRAIRASYIPYCRKQGTVALARAYGVANATISKIIRHERWGHVS